MIKRNSYNILFIVVCLLFSVAVSAQSKTAVSVTADRTKILIGEQIRLTLKADIPQNQAIRFFQFDSLPHFEFIKRDKIDTVNTSGGTVLTQNLLLTSFDSGHWVIPAFVWYDDVATDSVPVDVGFTPFDTAAPYHDIKDILGVKAEPEKKQAIEWWFYAIGGLIVLMTVVYFVMQRKKKPVPKPVEAPPDYYKIALAELAKLSANKPEAKQYYSRLVDIFRNYVSARKGIHSMQQTSDDLIVQLRSVEIPKEMAEKLSQCLRLSDFVKFAKYIPTAADDKDSFDIIRKSIDHIEQIK